MTKEKTLNLIKNNIWLHLALKSASSFFGGMILSLPYLSGKLSPFAASLCSALDGVYSVFACVGSAIGFFIFHGGLSSFRYFTVTLTSCVTLNISLRAFGLSRSDLLKPLCPGICALAVNGAFLLSQKFSPSLVISTLCETALCAAAVPVFTKGLHSLSDKLKRPLKSNEAELLFESALISIIAAHLISAGTSGEFMCFFVFTVMILFTSRKYSFIGSAVCSANCAFAYSLSGEADTLCVVLPLLGCSLPLINDKKRFIGSIYCAAAFLIACGVNERDNYIPLVAALAGGAIYCVIPLKYVTAENDSDKSVVITNEFAHLSHRNEMISAVESIGECVEAVRKTLEPLVAPKLADSLSKARAKTCDECEINSSCINEIRAPEHPCYQAIANGYFEGEVDFSLFPDDFTQRCYCADKMLSNMNNAYLTYCANQNADNKISRMQTVTCSQFKSFGSIIDRICQSAIKSGESIFCNDNISLVCAKEFGINIKSAKLVKNASGHSSYNISFYKPAENFNVTALTDKLCSETGLALDFPVLIQKDELYTLIFKQREQIGFRIAAAVKAADGKSVCGDYYRCFKDSDGRQCVMLSDGMGTGNRAAVDSAFTCEAFCNLVKAGVDEKSAASAVNCAMMIKSTDESLSTIDFVRIDSILCTAEIFKCGAAPTFIRNKNNTMLIETESTPIGILENIDMSHTALSLSPGDIILNVSDGVSAERHGWISAELKKWDGESASELARHILQCACDRQIGKRADDMTVIATIITKKHSD